MKCKWTLVLISWFLYLTHINADELNLIETGLNTWGIPEFKYERIINRVGIGVKSGLLTFIHSKIIYNDRWISEPELFIKYKTIGINNWIFDLGINVHYRYDSEKISEFDKNYVERGFIYDSRMYFGYQFERLFLSSSVGLAQYVYKSNLTDFVSGIKSNERVYRKDGASPFVSGNLAIGYRY